MITYKPKTLADQVYERLEFAILSGSYAPGEVLTEKRLAEELGVSRTPIREAVSRLIYDRLLIETPGGSEVRGISCRDVEDMFMVKRQLEIPATKAAAARMSEDELKALRDVVEQQEFYAGKGDAQKVRNLDTQFHDLIYAGSGSMILESILTSVHRKMMKFRRVSLENEGRILASVKEHKAILQAFEAHNVELVGSLMAEHVEHAYQSITASGKKC